MESFNPPISPSSPRAPSATSGSSRKLRFRYRFWPAKSMCGETGSHHPGHSGGKKESSRAKLVPGAFRTIFDSGLLSHMTLCSIIGEEELNYRVRNGIGCTLFSMAAKKFSKYN